MHSMMLSHLTILLSVIPDGPLCSQPLKRICQQQESSWTPMSLPATTEAESYFINRKTAGTLQLHFVCGASNVSLAWLTK